MHCYCYHLPDPHTNSISSESLLWNLFLRGSVFGEGGRLAPNSILGIKAPEYNVSGLCWCHVAATICLLPTPTQSLLNPFFAICVCRAVYLERGKGGKAPEYNVSDLCWWPVTATICLFPTPTQSLLNPSLKIRFLQGNIFGEGGGLF